MTTSILAFAALFAALDPYDYKELVTHEAKPCAVSTTASGHTLLDFGKDAVGWFEFRGLPSGAYDIVLGEMTNGVGCVTNAYPGSTIRVYHLTGTAEANRYRPPMPVDRLNTHGWDPKAPAILLPERIGTIGAFRYAEIVSAPGKVGADNAVRIMVTYPIDMTKSEFASDSAEMNALYELFKYSMLATSFCGVYVDGDRERTPYEADAYINMLGHYAIDDDYSLGRKSHEWLMEHPTWPTEWKQYSIMLAWFDWMWTGDTRSLAKYYGALRSDKLLAGFSTRADGLLVSSGDVRRGHRDIIDWPEVERDGYVLTPMSAVINAFYYRNLLQMADIAQALGLDEHAKRDRTEANRVKAAFVSVFRDPADSLYRDGEGVPHKSLHASAAALACGLVPESDVAKVVSFLDRKGLACSVYFAQILLEAFCEAGRHDLAVKHITCRGERSWMNAIDFGSTISLEAWNIPAKPNMDLNHAWGAAPLNILSRYLLGVTPLEPGFRKILVKPSLPGLGRVRATVPTNAGPVRMSADGGSLTVTVPAPARIVWGGKTHDVAAGTHTFAGGRK